LDAGRSGNLLDRQELGGVADFEITQDLVHPYSMTAVVASPATVWTRGDTPGLLQGAILELRTLLSPA
jgi:hypothetical protein